MIPRYDSPLMPATQTFSVECDAALEDLKFSACQMTDLRKRIRWLGLYSTFLPGKVGACVTNVMARFAADDRLFVRLEPGAPPQAVGLGRQKTRAECQCGLGGIFFAGVLTLSLCQSCQSR